MARRSEAGRPVLDDLQASARDGARDDEFNAGAGLGTKELLYLFRIHLGAERIPRRLGGRIVAKKWRPPKGLKV